MAGLTSAAELLAVWSEDGGSDRTNAALAALVRLAAVDGGHDDDALLLTLHLLSGMVWATAAQLRDLRSRCIVTDSTNPCEILQALGAAQVVPGEGPASHPSRLAELSDYLARLESAVEAAFARRVSLGDAAAAAPVPAFRHWAQYDNMHRKNVEARYLRLEKAGLEAR